MFSLYVILAFKDRDISIVISIVILKNKVFCIMLYDIVNVNLSELKKKMYITKVQI